MAYSSLPSPALVERVFDDEPTIDFTLPLAAGGGSAQPSSREHLTLFALLGTHGQTVVTIDTSPTILGRGSRADVTIPDRSLSRRHLRLVQKRSHWFAEDLDSRNGTFIDGARLQGSTELHDGMRLLMGSACLFRVGLSDTLEQTATVRMYESSVYDPLTRIHNRRYLDERLQTELAYARRHGALLTVLLLDIDHFKGINDTLGHQAGDAVLRVLGGALKRFCRTEDVIARFGGEEFALIARGIDERNAQILGERVRQLVSKLVLPWGTDTIRFTTSVGIATHTAQSPYESVAELIAAADGALYSAKRDGRNCCRRAQGKVPADR